MKMRDKAKLEKRNKDNFLIEFTINAFLGRCRTSIDLPK